jgi:hypothetical protein
MTRKPLFWILLVLLSIGSIFFTYTFFSDAFPIVSLDLQMDRTNALTHAKELAEKHRFGPEGYEQAASFRGDRQVQVFVELEGGGTEAFKEMMSKGLYMPYAWRVRHYKELETREAMLRFTPNGKPYGFVVKLPEKEAGPLLSSDSAQTIAVNAATGEWGIDLSQYTLVERSQEVRPGGRIDHTFVYERPNIKIGEGLYRLRLVVGGDKLTELTHFVKVPEAFERRYEEMRSANDIIGITGSVGMVVLYIVGGCGIGLFFLLRQRWVIWRTPVLWGLFIAFLQFLVGLNEWPLRWMDYDTALSMQNFFVQQAALLLLNFVVMGLLLSVSFMAAESLSRKAFPHHVQQWKLWSNDVAASKEVLGRTVAGYLLVGIFFAYEVALYFITGKMFGWWTPSDTLIHPDVLATYFPWLSSIAISAQAGFWEESLFRAVPIAGAALLGDRFGGRKWWIVGAMIVQALVFGAGHAGYANQPAYARVVELIIPSLMFGGIYLLFGLLPAVILHFVFDVVWFALPLFVSSAPGIWIDRGLVLLLTFVPLLIVLIARVRAKQWQPIADVHRNSSWTPSAVIESAKPVIEEKIPAPQPQILKYVSMAGFLGLAVWISMTTFQSDAPPMTVGMSEAETIAKRTLQERGIELPESWKTLATVNATPDQQDRFVWQKSGKELYTRLLGSHLSPPHWIVRFVDFEGDVAERAEEDHVYVGGDGAVFRFRHQLPEDRTGRTIAEQDARILAHLTLTGLFKMDATRLKEVSSVPSKLKERTDWTFTFADTINYTLPEGGEARIAVEIAGDNVVDAHKFVHVPEEWARQERDRQSLPGVIRIVCTVINVLLVITGIVVAIVRWSKKQFAAGTFLIILLLLLVVNALNLVNSLPGIIAGFSTAQPYTTQLLMLVLAASIGVLLLSISIALIAGLVHRWKENQLRLPSMMLWSWGISLGAIMAGVGALLSSLSPSLSPRWADYSSLTTSLPLVDVVFDAAGRMVTQSTVALFIFLSVDWLTVSWRTRRGLCGALLVLYGIVFVGSRSVETIPGWLGAGVVVGLLFLAAYVLILRFTPTVVVIAVGTLTLVNILREGFYDAYPQAILSATIAAVVVALVTWWWQKRLAPAQIESGTM